MLRHILFCVGCFWLEINCAFKILFGECFGKETRKEKKKRGKPLWNLAQLSPPPSLRSAQSRSARPSLRPSGHATRARALIPLLSAAGNQAPHGSALLFFFPAYPTGTFPSDAEPIPKTPGSPCYLVHQAPIKAQGPPRDFPLQFSASRGPYPPRSSSFRSRRVGSEAAAATRLSCSFSA